MVRRRRHGARSGVGAGSSRRGLVGGAHRRILRKASECHQCESATYSRSRTGCLLPALLRRHRQHRLHADPATVTGDALIVKQLNVDVFAFRRRRVHPHLIRLVMSEHRCRDRQPRRHRTERRPVRPGHRSAIWSTSVRQEHRRHDQGRRGLRLHRAERQRPRGNRGPSRESRHTPDDDDDWRRFRRLDRHWRQQDGFAWMICDSREPGVGIEPTTC